MLTRRIATFLIGAWLGCGILLSMLVLQNVRWAGQLLADPTDGARILFAKVGDAEARLLMDYLSAEQTRSYLYRWEEAQLVIGVVLIALLIVTSERRMFPIALTGAMLALVLFQHLGVSPELTFRGRQADFLAEESAFSVEARLSTLNQIYAGTEALKLLLGGVLASYFFAASSAMRMRKKKRRKESTSLREQD